MNTNKKNRNYIVTIVVLIIINIACLLLLWLGKPKHNMRNNENGEKTQIQNMLKKELGFSNEQTKQFLELRENHREQSLKLDEELKLLKTEMFEDAMYSSKEIISDSLLNLSLNKQGKLEELTFDHFLKLKQICTPEQQKKLFELVHTMLGPRQKDRPPDGAPHGELREGHPPPRNIN